MPSTENEPSDQLSELSFPADALPPESVAAPNEQAGVSTLALDAFARSIAVNRQAPHAFFLGAGTSVTSGVLSAEACIWQWKRRIFLSNNVGLEQQFADVSLPSVQQKIQHWLDDQGQYPHQGASDEYGFFVEACYPVADDRRQYFQSLIEGKRPYIGYDVLALLAEAGLARWIWTTNFDGFASRALTQSNVTVIEVGLDTAQRIDRQIRQGEMLYVALHGDYRYDALRNTPTELREGDRKLREALVRELRDKSLVVCGYSGRDDSVMEALEEAYSQPGPGRLYWCGYDQARPGERVERLLECARSRGRQAFYVPTNGFDDLMLRIALQALSGDLADRARALYSRAASEGVELAPFSVQLARTTSLIKSNAFPVDCPSEVLQFEIEGLPAQGTWNALREWTRGRGVVAVPHRGKALAIGTVDEVKDVFGDRLRGGIERSPIAPKELARSEGAVVSLLREALVRALANCRGLQSNGQDLVWMPEVKRVLQIDGASYHVHEAAVVLLRRYSGQQYLVVKPTLKVFTQSGEDAPRSAAQEAKRQLLTRQWNREFDQALEQWRHRLLPKGEERIEFPPDAGSTFRFTVSATPAHARLFNPHLRWSLTLPADVAHATPYEGIEYDEPQLVFSNRRGDRYVQDPHPVRGIVRNQPFDYALTERGFVSPDHSRDHVS